MRKKELTYNPLKYWGSWAGGLFLGMFMYYLGRLFCGLGGTCEYSRLFLGVTIFFVIGFLIGFALHLGVRWLINKIMEGLK